MRARYLSLLLPGLLWTPACHLNLLLEGEGYACATDDNCPQGLHCVEGACVRGDAGAGDAGVADRAIVDGGGADLTQATDAARPDTSVATDAVRPDTTTPADVFASPDTLTGVDATAGQDAAVPDGATPDAQVFDAILVSGEAEPSHLAADDTHLYWTTDLAGGFVRRVPKAGGPATTVTGVTSPARPTMLALGAAQVFFVSEGTTGSDDDVYQVAKGDVQNKLMIASDQYIRQEFSRRALWTAQDKVYWCTTSVGSNLNLRQHSVGDAQDSYLSASTGVSFPRGFTLLDGRLYFVQNEGSAAYLDAPFAQGAAASTLVAVGARVQASAAVGDRVYWSVPLKVATATPARIGYLTTAGTMFTLLDPAVDGDPTADIWDLAADAASVCFTVPKRVTLPGKVLCHDLVGGTTQVRHAGGDPRGIALDDGWVYWADSENSEIRRLAR